MRQKMILRFTVWLDGKEKHMEICGKSAKTLYALMSAGNLGITALEMSNTWALRLSAYIHDLRGLGLDIKTVKEEHEDGWHARYYLQSPVEILELKT